jgi:hypothetical protein
MIGRGDKDDSAGLAQKQMMFNYLPRQAQEQLRMY